MTVIVINLRARLPPVHLIGITPTIPLKPLVLAVAEQMAPMVVVQVVESIRRLNNFSVATPGTTAFIM